jgi:hypothetical protein
MNAMSSIRTIVTLFLLSTVPLIGQINYDAWDFVIKGRNTLQSDSLAHLGIRTDATADYDNQYDVPRPPRSPSGAYLEIYFPHTGGSYPPILGSKYATDYQAPADPVWSMSVEASAAGPLTLSWDSSYVDQIEPRAQLLLHDIAAGTYTNMRAAGSYSFTYSIKRNFEIVGSIKIDLTFLLEGLWNGAAQVRDTVSVYLASGIAPHAIIDSARVYLSTAGAGLLPFPAAPSGSYYVAVRHRNHMETWSAAPVALVRATTSFTPYDFSGGASQAYGTNALKTAGAVAVAWAGDVNQDGVIDFLDRNLTWNNRSQAGYLSTDCTGDNMTDSADDALVLGNRLIVRQRP